MVVKEGMVAAPLTITLLKYWYVFSLLLFMESFCCYILHKSYILFFVYVELDENYKS